MPILQLLSQIGVLLFMFVVGVELEPSYLRGKAHTAIAVSHFSIVIPFTLGVALSLALYTQYAPAGVPFHAFALFCGIAMSITAFPVLARILEERHLTHTPLGATAITCAAVDDVTAWSILAFVVAITTAGGAVETLLAIVALSVMFVLLMIVRRPPGPAARAPPRTGSGDTLSKEHIAIVLVVLLSSALVTEIIGIHALFGAFVAGAIMPVGGTFRAVLRDRLESISSVFLLPLFFVYTGLRTQIGLLDDVASWAICLAIIVVATDGQARRHGARRALDRSSVARLGRARRAHEHARADGARRAQRRLRPGHPHARDLRHDGADGARDHGDDRTAAVAQPQLGPAPRARRGRPHGPLVVTVSRGLCSVNERDLPRAKQARKPVYHCFACRVAVVAWTVHDSLGSWELFVVG